MGRLKIFPGMLLLKLRESRHIMSRLSFSISIYIYLHLLLVLVLLTDHMPFSFVLPIAVLMECSGLFIEPRNAQVLSDSRLLAIWGERPSISAKDTTETIDSAGGDTDGKVDLVV